MFIPRLWATRKIGALLNTIRLNGEDPELVDAIVRLSIRYGIITPYTSFLITEDDIFSQSGREEAQGMVEQESTNAFSEDSGAVAVDAAESAADLSAANAPMEAPAAPPPDRRRDSARKTMDELAVLRAGQWLAVMVMRRRDDGSYSPEGQAMQYAGDRTFVWRDGAWIDTLYDPDTMTPTKVVFLSDEYFELLDLDPAIGEFLALGEHVLFVWEGAAYEVVPE